jgi:HK97 family phage major capsid protein
MFTEQQLAAFKAMTHEQIQKRFKEIQEEVNRNDPNLNLEMLQAEIDILQKRDKELQGKAAQRQAFLDTMAKSIEDEEETFVTQQEQARSKAHPTMPKGLSERKKGMEDDMEYRSAFMEFVQKGKRSEILRQRTEILRQRNAEKGVAADLGILIPETIVQKVMTELSKSRGYLYNAVLHTDLPGGVKYPIGTFKATFKRITEEAVSDRQKAGSVTGSVQFGYLIGEIRLARTLLQTVLTVNAFETKLAEVIVEAYLEAMDREILTGQSENNECEGILTEANKVSGRIKTDHIIEFTAEEMKDWKSWQTKFFAKIPLSMRKLKPEFVMTPATYEANIKTLADQNNRPVYAETFNPVDGAERATFKARIVNFVENDTFKDFDEAKNGEYFGMYWVGKEAYAINSNMMFGVKKYWDYEKNEEVTQALVINDGKVLDPQYIFLLKKKVA